MASVKLPPGVDLSKIPVGQPPNGVTPNFVDPPSSLKLLTLILLPILMFVMLILVLTRLSLNFRSLRRFAADDICCIVALIFAIVQCTLAFACRSDQFSKLKRSDGATALKYARHSWDIPVSWINSRFLEMTLFSQSLLGLFSQGFAKLAILFLYLRIFTLGRGTKYMVYGGMLWTTITYLPTLVTDSYFCAPHSGQPWTGKVTVSCAKTYHWELAMAAMSLALDLFLLLFPALQIAKLQISTPRKWKIIFVYLIATGVLACAVLTLYFGIKAKHSTDPFWNAWKLVIVSIAEGVLVIIIGSLPDVFLFFKNTIAPTRISHTRIGSTSQLESQSRGTTEKHTGLKSASRIPYDDHNSEKSTTHLQKVKGRITTEVLPALPHKISFGDGITRSVEFEQSSTRGSVVSYYVA